ncbi:MAG: hypothetical protein JOZ38_07635 [Candidatus Eremiobacteraeota bacterium]|nr:hypothetical protein [Candidatus Eremiobacteraeota bacterium]
MNRPNNGTVNRPNNGGNRQNNVNGGNRGNGNFSGNTVNRGGNTVNVNRTVIANPIYRGPAWGWNHGVVWAPAPYYWGGGFWGAFAIGATSAAIYGTIVRNNTTYTSYQVAPSSPGATLLSNYGLTQVQCGPSNLVVIDGPNNSVICANPNATVAAGYYTIDSSNLSIVSA